MTDDWKKLVPNCFGCVDGVFAMHQIEKNYARELRKECKKNNIALEEIFNECECYLQSQNATPEHIGKQMKEIRKYFSSLS